MRNNIHKRNIEHEYPPYCSKRWAETTYERYKQLGIIHDYKVRVNNKGRVVITVIPPFEVRKIKMTTKIME